MFRHILFTIFFLFSLNVFAQIPTQGLLGYYPFCGNTNDMSGNGHHLINSNATLTTNRFGVANSAYSFNGINSMIYNDTIFTLNNQYTFSSWFLANSVQDGLIVYNGNSNSNGVGLVYDNGAAVPGTKGTMLAGGICFCMAKPASLNQWHHMVLKKLPTKFKLYIDNVAVDSATSSINSPVGKFQLGKDYTNGTNSFDGKIDDVAIYNRALSDSEISQLFYYQCGSTVFTASPQSSVILVNNSTSFSIPILSTTTSYQWQQNIGAGFTNLSNTPPFSGVNTNTLTITNAPLTLNNTLYRCIITDISCCTDTSSNSTLFVTTTTTTSCLSIQNLPDTIVACANSTLQLNPSLNGTSSFTPFDTTWAPSTGLSNPNIINPTVNVGSTSTNYVLTVVGVSATNLVVNGDFSAGNTGFNSSYSLGTGGTWGPCSNPATYDVVTDPINAHNLWSSFGDHTTGTGNMLAINGANTPNVSVWCETVNVTPNTYYDFSTWVASVDPQNTAILQFSINGNLINSAFNAPSTTGNWIQFHDTWFSGANTTATICINNQNTAFVGNDFALDDISFRTACIAQDSVYIKVIPLPIINAGSDTSICKYSTIQLQATGANSYTWSPTTGLSCINCSNPLANPTVATTYVVSGTDTNGCVNTDNVKVSIFPQPVISAGADQTICNGKGAQLQASGGQNYTWSPITSLSCIACPNPIASPNTNIIYTVVGTDANGCQDSDKVAITVIQMQPFTIGKGDTLCQGESTQLFVDGGDTYTWLPPTGLDNPNIKNPTAAPTVTTTYQIIIKQGICFADTANIIVIVNPQPTVNAGPDEHILLGSSVNLNATSTNTTQYLWSPSTSLSCDNCNSPVATPKQTTTYTVYVSNLYGCKAQDSVTIFVICDKNPIFVANTFTPNGDGNNDRFYPQGNGISTINRFRIYDRWGELLFDEQNFPANNDLYGWDGTYKGNRLKPDVFVYIIDTFCENGEPIELKGNVALIR